MSGRRLSPGLIVPDVHAPYHDRRAWELMLSVARELRPETIVVIGDLVDFYSVSAHSKDPNRAFKLEAEVESGVALLGQLDDLGATKKVFTEGNHENRLERYLRDKAPELYGMAALSDFLVLEENGWVLVPYQQHIKLGKVYYTHDAGKTGRYSTYQTLDAFQHSVVFGHSHRMSYVVEGDATGASKVGAQFGWLGDVSKADYMHRVKANRDWATGFGVSYTDHQTGHTFLTPIPIVQGRCVFNGRLYVAPPARRHRGPRAT